MSVPLLVGGGVAGGIAGVIGGRQESAAIGKQQREQKSYMDDMLKFLRDEQATGRAWFGQAKGELGQAERDLRGRSGRIMDTGFEQRREALEGRLGIEGELFQRTIGDIFTEGRRMSSGTGLFGGLQESQMVNPAIERAATNYLGTVAGMEEQLSAEELQTRLGTETAMSQFFTGSNQQMLQQMLGGSQATQQQAFGGYTGARQGYIKGLGNYKSSPVMDFLSGGMRGVGQMAKAVGDFSGNSKGGKTLADYGLTEEDVAEIQSRKYGRGR